MAIAWVFPGQGSQKLGMAEPLMSLAHAKDRFQYASDLLDRDLLEICMVGNQSEGLKDLNDTRNTQPALFVVESLLVDALKSQGRTPSILAGHSLGEFVALYAGEVIDFKTTLNLLKIRSELMSSVKSGGMTAVLGFDMDQLQELLKGSEDVFIANDNSSSQVVLSGDQKALEELSSQLKCKRAISLAVSGAFHSPFMQQASQFFAKELDNVNFKDSIIPVISNSDPTICSDGDQLKLRLSNQMTRGVRWRETMQEMSSKGISTVVEIGPGNVLSGLVKRSMNGVLASQISVAADLG